MYSQGHRPLDLESMSSQTTDVTSRATTISDSASDATLTLQQEKGRINIQRKEEEWDRSLTPTTNTASVNTVISKNSNGQRAYNNQTNAGNQQQQSWVNPYWGSNAKSNAAGLQSGTNKVQNNANNGYSSSFTGVQQLIPGSIIINERGEINNLSRQQNTNLGGKFVSDNSNSPGGYLAPTHIQRSIVTSSPGLTTHPENQFAYKRSSSSGNAINGFRPAFNRQQTFPQTKDNNIQSWVNPYWPKPNQTITSQPSTDLKQISWDKPYSSTVTSTKTTPSSGTWTNPYWKDWKPQTSSSTKQEQQAWTNPYWKDGKPQTSTSSKPNDQKWTNPYWKDEKPQTPTISKPNDQPWENPYWKPQGSTTSSQQQDKSWQNPYWKDKNTSNQSTNSSALNRSLPFEYRIQSIPSFYKRIYPPSTPSSSPVPTTPIKQETQFSTETSKQNINDNDDLPFTIDSQGTAHYRAAPSSMSSTNKTVTFDSSPITSQYPVSPPDPPNAAPAPQKSFTTSSPKPVNTPSFFQTNSSVPPSHSSDITSPLFSNSTNYPLPSTSSSSSLIVITEADLDSIQHALQLLATNSSSITVVETPNQIPSSNISYQDNRSPPSFTSIQNQQSYQQPPLPSSNISYQDNRSPPSFTSIQNQQSYQQPPLPSSNINYQDNRSPPSFTSIQNQQSYQQPPLPSSNISYQDNRSPPSFTSIQDQQSYQQPPLPSSNISYSDNALPSLFTNNPEQRSHQQGSLSSSSSHIPFNSSPYSYDSNAQQLTVFSTPSYPSQSNEPSRRLITQGSILLI